MADTIRSSGLTVELPQGGRGEGLAVLSDTGIGSTKKDCKLLEAAIRHGWPVPAEVRQLTVERLTDIVSKRTVEVPTKDGTFDSAYHADGNAIAAARVLVAATGQNQKDRHAEMGVGGAITQTLVVNIIGVNDPDPEAKGPEVVATQ